MRDLGGRASSRSFADHSVAPAAAAMGDAVAAAAPLLLDGRLLHGVNTALVLLISVAPILSADAAVSYTHLRAHETV